MAPNYTHFSNAQVDSLYLASFSINDKNSRINQYRVIDSLIMEEAPVAVLYYDKVIRFVQKDIIGMTIKPYQHVKPGESKETISQLND